MISPVCFAGVSVCQSALLRSVRNWQAEKSTQFAVLADEGVANWQATNNQRFTENKYNPVCQSIPACHLGGKLNARWQTEIGVSVNTSREGNRNEQTRLGKWSSPDVPHRGWQCLDFEDLEEPSEVCQMCEAQEIRYVHVMGHPKYSELLRCGCICAEHMEGDYIAARRREASARNRAIRRARWLTRTWRTSVAGNEYLNTDGCHVVIYAAGSIWRGRIEDKVTGRNIYSKRPYATSEAAKIAAFDALWILKSRRRSHEL